MYQLVSAPECAVQRAVTGNGVAKCQSLHELSASSPPLRSALQAALPASPSLAALPTCNTASPTPYASAVPLWATFGPTWESSWDCLLRQGNTGDGVRWLQENLNHCYGAGLAVDGNFRSAPGRRSFRRSAARAPGLMAYTAPIPAGHSSGSHTSLRVANTPASELATAGLVRHSSTGTSAALSRLFCAELVTFGIGEDPPAVMFGHHRRAQSEELRQVSVVSEPDVDVHAVLRGLGFGTSWTKKTSEPSGESMATVGSVSGVRPRRRAGRPRPRRIAESANQALPPRTAPG